MLRALTTSDLPAATALLGRAGLASGVQNIARYLAWQPDGAWGTFEGDELTGMVTLLHQGTVGFVGCMAVEPALHGKGIGRRLLDHAHASGRRAGIATFLLEATPLGEHLYGRLGYVAEYDSIILTREGPVAHDLPSITRADHAAIFAIDELSTGTRRSVMLGNLLAEHPGIAVSANGEIAGYGLAVSGRLGPVIARDPDVGRRLIETLFGASTHLAVPAPNEVALAACTEVGFTEARRLRRMRLGAAIPVRVDWVWTLASAGAG